mgnify:CR=1 FL=1
MEIIIGSNKITTPHSLDIFATFYNKYSKIGVNLKSDFLDFYASQKNIDDVLSKYESFVEKSVDILSEEALKDISSNNIFDTSKEEIVNDIIEIYKNASYIIENVLDEYNDIIESAQELRESRRDDAENRSRLVGGGFGIKGAAKGITEAAVANAAYGMTYKLFNFTKNMASSLSDNIKKQRLFNDKNTPQSLSDIFYEISIRTSYLTAERINSSSANIIYSYPTEEDEKKSLSIIENVVKNRIPKESVESAIVKSIQLNPFNKTPWETFLNIFGDKNHNISETAELFSVDLFSLKARLILEKKQSLDWSTKEKCIENSENLKSYMTFLGEPFDKEQEIINDKINSLLSKPTDNQADSQTHNQTSPVSDSSTVTQSGSHTKNSTSAQSGNQTSNQSYVGILTDQIKKSFDFKGRASRKEFWSFFSFILLIIVFTSIITSETNDDTQSGLIGIIIILFCIPYISSQVRRFHDQGKSGWYTLLNLIPYIGPIIVLIFMCFPGNDGGKN